MNAAYAKLADYFGTIGMASIVAWIAAAALCALFILGWRRSKVCWSALAVAIAALVLAEVNSDYVSAIKIDWSEELQAAKARAAEEEQGEEEEKEEGTDISDEAKQALRDEAAEKEPTAAEEKPEEEPREGANVSDEAEAALRDEAAEEEPEAAVEDESGPAYRRQGRAQRAEGMQVEEKVPIGPGTTEQPIGPNVRKMKMHDVTQANRLDRLNLLFARCTFYLAVLLVVVDYFRRFNKTFESYLPLPLGGRLVDSLFAKSHVEHVPRDRAPRLRQFLKQTVRKGETFIYFGRDDPWPESSLRRLPWFVPAPWRLEKVVCTDGDGHPDDEFLFESAWFNRYCFVHVGGEGRVLDRLDAMAEFLELRHETRATAAHTVNVVWDLERAIPRGTLDRLLPLCREANFRLILPSAPM